MVDETHRGEQVGGDAGPPPDGRGRDVLVGVRVSEGHLDARPRETPGGVLSPVISSPSNLFLTSAAIWSIVA